MIETADEHFAIQTIRGSHSITPTEPVKVAHRRILVIDDSLIDDSWNCQRTVHQPEKHGGNPLILPASPAYPRGMPFISVIYDPADSVFRLWGSAPPREGTESNFHGVYFESRDGVDWVAPRLGKFTIDGGTSNNVFFAAPQGRVHDSFAVIRVPAGWEHLGRYAMVYGSSNVGSYLLNSQARIDLAFSDNGIDWTPHRANPILEGQSDTHNNLVYIPERNSFILYHRPVVNALYNRRVAMTESLDLESWTQPKTILFPDELDPPHLYGMTVDRYQGIYLGFLMVYYRSDIADLPSRAFEGHKAWPEFTKELQMENELVWSNDGVSWSRHPGRHVFLQTGRRFSACDWAFARKGTGLVERGDDIYIYYEGADRIKKTDYTDRSGNWSVCLATMKRDRFVSLDSRREGLMLTVPLDCPGGRLHINAATKRGGSISIAMRRGDGARDGEMIDGRTFAESIPFEGDSTDHVVDWRGEGDQDRFKDQAIRLHFWLRDASLFSYWFG